jgi:hypothetical protein
MIFQHFHFSDSQGLWIRPGRPRHNWREAVFLLLLLDYFPRKAFGFSGLLRLPAVGGVGIN